MSVSPCSTEAGEFGFDYSIKPYFSQYLLHILKMTKCTLVFSILSLVVLLIITGIHGAPAAIALTTKSLDKEPSPANQMIFNILPSPPLAREEREIIPTISTPDTAPKYFSFIKNTQCQLYKPDGTRKAKMCGLRELDLPGGASGIKSWNPRLCHSFHCKCVATKQVKRMKRTIADNKTTLEYHRFRIFECV